MIDNKSFSLNLGTGINYNEKEKIQKKWKKKLESLNF